MTLTSQLVTIRRSSGPLLTALLLLISASVGRSQELPDAAREQYEEVERIYGEGRARTEGRDGEEDIRGRDAWFHFQRSYPYGQIPADGRRNALRATSDLEKRLQRAREANGKSGALFASTMWESIGPGNQGGRIRAIAIHPTRSGTFLVGAAAGGVWKTTDGGDTWQPTMDKESAIAIGSLAFDHSDPNIVYAGTGENYPSSATLLINTPTYLGDGIFKSTDEGLTWTHMGLDVAGAVSKVAVHRQKPATVYAAVAKQNGGFFRSTDAGATWTQTAMGDLYDLAVNPQNSDELYIAHSNSIRRSTDGGLTFTTVNNGISTAAGVRFSVSISASSPSTLYVLAARGAGDENQEIAEIYKTTNRGDSWQLRTTLGEQFFNNQGIYDNFIAVHPTNPDIVLAGGIDVYRTDDGGSSWENTTRVYTGGDVHPDQHTAVFDPLAPAVAILGNDGGVYTSVDAGINWTRQSDGLEITQFYRMDVDQTRPFRVYGGTQDNGTSGSFGTSGFTRNWTHVLGGDGFWVVTDKRDPNWFYAEMYYGTLFRINANNPNQRSRIDDGIPSSDEGNWATPIAMSDADDRSLYSGRLNLWRSTDNGDRWTRLPVGVTTKLAAIGLSPTDANRIVVGTVTGAVRASTDYGATWTSGRGVPPSCVTDIRFDPVAPSRVYLTLSGFGPTHVLRSDNDGVDWTNITSNMPGIPVNAIEIDPVETNRLFIATDVGVFFSPNGGDFWIPFNQGLPLAPISDLRIHRSSRYLVAATHGRSMFRASIDNLEIDPTLVQPIGGERVSTPGPLVVQWFGLTGPVTVSIKYSVDEPYQVLASNVTDDRVTLSLPMRISSTARVRVEEIGTGRAVTSGFFSLVTESNVTSLGRRGFIAEAIELRGSTLWATTRDSDTIVRLRSPLLTGMSPIVRTGFSGTIRDLAYDAARDQFLALVTADDFTQPQIFRMDTMGRSLGAVALPAELTAAVGIAVRGEVLAVTTPAPGPVLWEIDPVTGEERSRSAIAEATGETRHGLVWNGRAYVQGVALDSGDAVFGSELQQISGGDPIRVFDRLPVVLPTGGELAFFGLAFDPGTGPAAYYFATDTSGTFYRFRTDILSGIGGETFASRASGISAAHLRPNPAIGSTSLELRVERAAEISVGVTDASGRRHIAGAARLYEAGLHAITIDVATLPSGLYYVVLEAAGERLVRPLSVVR
jgi:photosystem II stability/assembly factor-like uncharacterized protein